MNSRRGRAAQARDYALCERQSLEKRLREEPGLPAAARLRSAEEQVALLMSACALLFAVAERATKSEAA